MRSATSAIRTIGLAGPPTVSASPLPPIKAVLRRSGWWMPTPQNASQTPRIYQRKLPGRSTRPMVPTSCSAVMSTPIAVAGRCLQTRRHSTPLKTTPSKARLYDSLLYRHWTQWQTARRSHLLVYPGRWRCRARSLRPASAMFPSVFARWAQTITSSHLTVRNWCTRSSTMRCRRSARTPIFFAVPLAAPLAAQTEGEPKTNADHHQSRCGPIAPFSLPMASNLALPFAIPLRL